MFRLATARQPDRKELAELASVFKDFLTKYMDDTKAANQVVANAESRPNAALNPPELAAWTMIANLILNLDEVLSKG
jgi:hypothetical protein